MIGSAPPAAAPARPTPATSTPGRTRGWYGHVPVLILLAGYAAVVLLTFRDYGIPFDEEWQAEYGEKIITWFQSGFTDLGALNYRNLAYYGGLFEVLAESVWRFSPFGQFETRHLVTALTGVAGAGFAYLLGLRLFGRLGGFLAALFLTLTPFYYGHAFNNSKDIPFAVAYLAALWAIVRVLPSLPAVRWRDVALIGVAIGAALGVRIGGVLLVAYLAFAWFAWLVTMRRPHAFGAAARALLPRFAAACAVAYATMIAFWPAAIVDPVRHPLRTLRVMGDFDWDHPIIWEGRTVLAGDLPHWFIEKYALLTLPEFVLVGIAAAAVLGVIGLVRAIRRRRIDLGFLGFAVVVLAIVLPPLYADVTDATVYDGLRHFLFVFPPLIVLAGGAVAWLLGRARPVAAATAAVVVAGIALTVTEMVRLHPYQYIYFNHAFAGGLARAHASYETDYWGIAFKEAAEWVAGSYDTRALPRPLRVASCGYRLSTAYYLPDGTFRHVPRATGKPDLFLGSKRFACDRVVGGTDVHTIARAGAPLVVIREVTPFARSRRLPRP